MKFINRTVDFGEYDRAYEIRGDDNVTLGLVYKYRSGWWRALSSYTNVESAVVPTRRSAVEALRNMAKKS